MTLQNNGGRERHLVALPRGIAPCFSLERTRTDLGKGVREGRRRGKRR
jgi:hypothetical protein